MKADRGGRAAIQHHDDFSNFLDDVAWSAWIVMLGISRDADHGAG